MPVGANPPCPTKWEKPGEGFAVKPNNSAKPIAIKAKIAMTLMIAK